MQPSTAASKQASRVFDQRITEEDMRLISYFFATLALGAALVFGLAAACRDHSISPHIHGKSAVEKMGKRTFLGVTFFSVFSTALSTFSSAFLTTFLALVAGLFLTAAGFVTRPEATASVRGLDVLALVDFFGPADSATDSTLRGTVMPDCDRVLERAVVVEAILFDL